MARTEHALIVAAGDVDAVWLRALLEEEARLLLIAADGGAASLRAIGRRPDMVIGDFDSLSRADRDALEADGVELRVAPADKDESDMELCLLAALEAGVERVSILGALGAVRPEHSLANLLLLADPRFDGVELQILSRGSRIARCGTAHSGGAVEIEGEPGDFVSLFPLGAGAEGVSTAGLRFPLRDEALPLGPSRGLSNELLDRRARVAARRGRLLVVHTERSIEDRQEEPV